MVYFNCLDTLDSHPQRLRMTIAITDSGGLKAWKVADLQGTVLEEWTADVGDEAHQYTWQVDWDAYLVVRDMLRFIGEADWEPGTVM